MPVRAAYLFLAGTGGVFAWAGIKGKSPTGVIRALIGGDSPSTAPAANLLTGTQSATLTGTGAPGAGTDIAGDALQYAGHAYVYGGPSNPQGGWDCSSFVSYVLGHDLGYAIPGGTWAAVTSNGSTHGPVAAQYLVWTAAATIPRAQVQPGDLLCWQTHVGFAASPAQMISAYDTETGTAVTPIDGAGPSGEILVCRRVKAA